MDQPNSAQILANEILNVLLLKTESNTESNAILKALKTNKQKGKSSHHYLT